MSDNEEFKKLMNTQVVKDYRRIALDGLKNSYPLLSENEISIALDWSIASRYKNRSLKMENNYTKQTINGTVIDILKYIESLQPILTSSGVLFKQHKKAENPMDKMIQGFLDQRAAYKKEMFKYPKGTSEFEKYNLFQLLEKLNAKLVGELSGDRWL